MANDIVAVVKWIHKNAMFLGIDARKICLYGCSGGGYACSAAASMLALKDESHLVKMVFLN